MGLFDDIPMARASRVGLFDDIPQDEEAPRLPQVDMSVPRPVRSGGSVSRRDGRVAPEVGDGEIASTGSRGRGADRIAADEITPQPMSDLGRRTARGATTVFSAIPKQGAIMQSRGVDDRIADTESALSGREQQIDAVRQRLSDPSLSEDERAFREQQLSDLLMGQEAGRQRIETMRDRSEIPTEERPAYQLGEKLDQSSLDFFGAPDPQFDDRFASKAAEGLGSLVGFAATTALTGWLGGAVTGAAGNSVSVYEEAKANGASEDEARAASSIAGLMGTTEVLPIGYALNRMTGKAKSRFANAVSRRLFSALETAGQEGAQEAAMQIANNLTLSGVANLDRKWSEGALEAAALGAVLGGPLGALTPGPTKGQSPLLTPEDNESPLRNEDIGEGKEAIDAMLNEPAGLDVAPEAPNTAPDVRVPEPEIVQRPLPTDRLSPTLGAAPQPDAAPEAPSAPQEQRPAPARRLSAPLEDSQVPGRMVQVDLDTGDVVEVAPQQPVAPPEPTASPAPEADGFTEPNESVIGGDEYRQVPPIEQVSEQGDVRAEATPPAPEAVDASIPEVVDPAPAVPVARQTVPRERLKRRPLTDLLKAEGVQPGSPLAVELSARGIDQRTTPGLFKAGGRTDWDNLPVSEWSDFAPIVGEDGNGYLSRDGLIEAVENEMRGQPVQVGEQARLQEARDLREYAARFDDDTPPIDLSDAPEISIEIPVRDEDVSTDAERRQMVERSVNGVLEQVGLSNVVTPVERTEITNTLTTNGGNVEDVVWGAILRSVDDFATEDSFAAAQQRTAQADTQDGGVENTPEVQQSAERPSSERGAQDGSQASVEDGGRADERQASAAESVDLPREPNGRQAASWVIRERDTGAVVMETTDPAKVRALNEDRFEAVAAGQHLAEINDPTRKAYAAARPEEPTPETTEEPETATEQTDAGEQTLMPGVAPITERDRQRAEIERRQNSGMTGRDEGPGSGRDDLFGAPEDRRDLFDAAPEPEAPLDAQTEFDRAEAEYKKEFERHEKVKADYRNREIDDDEFFASRERMNAAMEKADKARERLTDLDQDQPVDAVDDSQGDMFNNTPADMGKAAAKAGDDRKPPTDMSTNDTTAWLEAFDEQMERQIVEAKQAALEEGGKPVAPDSSVDVIKYKPSEASPTLQESEASARANLPDSTIKYQRAPAVDSKAFKDWFGNSKVVDADGNPLVVYHGTRSDFESFSIESVGSRFGVDDFGFFFTASQAEASRYADGYDMPEGRAVIPAYLNISNPLDWRAVMFYEGWGSDADTATKQQISDFARTEMSGRSAIEYFEMLQSSDWLERIKDGSFDGVILQDPDNQSNALYIATRPEQIKSAYNRGTFDPADPRIMYRRGATKSAIWPNLPELRAELDKIGLTDVDLQLVEPDPSFQGALRIDRKGGMTVLIGASLDDMATLRHEAIHALKAMGLFGKGEWSILSQRAAREWMAKHDIEARYPELSPLQKIEEAIAEEYAAWAKGGGKNGSFAKIKKFLEALGNMLRGQGFQTVEDVFGNVSEGVVGNRDAVDASEGVSYQRPPLNAQGRETIAKMTNAPHLPDREVFNKSVRENEDLFKQVSEARGGVRDALDRSRVKWQDRMLPLRRVEESIEATTGKTISKAKSVYSAEERYSNFVGNRLEYIRNEYTKVIARMIGRNQKHLKLTDPKGNERTGMAAVDLYLWARHAKERNARISKINPEFGGPTQGDLLNEYEPFSEKHGSGMSDAQADAIIAEAEKSIKRKVFKDIGALTDKLGAEMIQWREDAGLLSKEEAAIWRAMYKHYVPLRGWAETEMHDAVANDSMGGGISGFSATGKESKAATGRTTEAFPQMATMIAMAEEVAVRAEKNRVAQILYNLAEENPSQALWRIKGVETRRYYNSATGMVEAVSVSPTAQRPKPNEMAVKIDGVEKRVELVDPRIARAIRNLGVMELDRVSRSVQPLSRLFSATNTMLNPAFVIVNAFRDMVTAQFNLSQLPKEIRGKVRKAAVRDFFKAGRGAYSAMRGSENSDFAKHFQEFKESGGKVSFWAIENPEARADSLAQAIKREGDSKLGRALRKGTSFDTDVNPVLNWIETVNLAVDNATRLAVFVEARKQGMPVEDAASLSKNLTVNFNRRGEYGATMNAWYPFFNAAVQGSHVLVKVTKDNPKQMGALLVGSVGIALALDLLNASVSDEDDDGELAYDKIPDFVTSRSLVLPVGAVTGSDTYITVPLPYGYNAFFHAGQQMGKMIRGVKSQEDAVVDVMATTFSAFSPITGEGEDIQGIALKTVSPLIVDMALELKTNEDWLGRPIRPEYQFNDYGPRAYKMFKNEPPAPWPQLSDALNRATGGNELEAGYLDISPEYFHHLQQQLLGGAGRFVDRTVQLGTRAVQGELGEVEAYQVPLLRTLRYEPGDFLDQGRYFEFRQNVSNANAMVNKRASELDVQPSDELVRASRLYPKLRAAERQRKAISEDIDAIYADQSLSYSERRQRLRPLEEKRHRVYIQFNRDYVRMMGPQAE